MARTTTLKACLAPMLVTVAIAAVYLLLAYEGRTGALGGGSEI